MLIRRNAHWLLLCAVVNLSLPDLVAQEVAFPSSVGVINVTEEPWNFDNTGSEDITAAFQQLVDETIPRKTISSPEGYWPSIIYFPNGTYRLSDSVVGAVLNFGAALGGFVIQGESRDGVVLRLDDSAAGFGDRNQPKVLLDYFAGNGTNNAFINMLENVTIDVGSGNPGAIGVRFHANNTGAVRNVTIRSSDPGNAGFAGLEAVKNTNGPWLIRGMDVVGFEYGLNLGNTDSGRHMVSIQDLSLRDQQVAGIQLNEFQLNAYNTVSRNSVPLVIDRSPASLINLINLDLQVPEEANPAAAAIQSASPVYLRNVNAGAFPALVASGGNVLLQQLDTGNEWFSTERNFLWESTPARSLNLPIEQAPEPAWADPADWAVLTPNGSTAADMQAIRAAMHSGKSTIVFRPGTYRISDTIRIPPHVQRVAGQWALFRTETGLTGDGRPMFELGPSTHDTVVIEKIRGRFDAQNNPNPLIHNASHGNLVLRDIFWVSGPVYRNEPTRGRLFIENVHSLPGSQNNALDIPAYAFRGQDIWAWQWNPEMLFPHAIVDGGRLFVFGAKTGEMRGPIIDVRNHGYAELFGISMNVTHDHLDIDPEETVMLHSVDGNVSANFVEHAQLTGGGMGWGRHHFVAIETRGDERRELLTTDPSIVHNTLSPPQFGVVMSLYTGYFDQDNPANVAPQIGSVSMEADVSGFSYTFRATANDPDAAPAASAKLHWRVIDGPGIARTADHVGEEVTFEFERAGEYLVEVTATDGALETAQSFPLRVLPKHIESRLGRNDVNRYVDNAPQDGVVDLFHPALLQLGDDAANAHSHLRFELDITALKGSADRIREANLYLRVDTISGLESFTVSYATEEGHGVFNASDFNSERTALETVSLAGIAAGDVIPINLRPAVLHALENDFDYLSVWLAADFSNDNTAQLVRFSSTVASDESQRPLFMVAMGNPGLREGAVAIGGGWFEHPVFGRFHDFPPFVYHAAHGWLYLPEGAVDEQGQDIFSFSDGWLRISETFYPWTFSYDRGKWEQR